MVLTILLFIVILGVLVFIHEYGHFSSARRLGVDVEEFGFGFPPRLFGIRRGTTIYSINSIPFGGFVRLRGENGDGALDQRSFASQRVWKRLVILLSGVGMNILLAALLFSFVFSLGVPTVLDDSSIPGGGRVVDRKVQIVGIVGDSPAAQAGLAGGDAILEIGERPVHTVSDVTESLRGRLNQATELRIQRGDEQLRYSLTPAQLEGSDEPRLGVSLAETGFVSYPWYTSLWLGPWYAIKMLGVIFASLGTLVVNLIQQGQVSGDVTGPIGIAVVTGQVIDLGFIYILQFAALLSLSLAAMNVLPIPALDGGRALFVVIEKIRGRAMSAKVEGLIHTIGFYALLLFIAVISYRDFFRFGLNEQLTSFFKNLVS